MMRPLAAILVIFSAVSATAATIPIQSTGFPGYCGQSLECMIGRNDIVVRATINSVNVDLVEANITEAIRGSVACGANITVQYGGWPVNRGDDVVLMLHEEENGRKIPGTFFLRRPINLDGQRPYYEMDVCPITQPAAILASVRKIAARPVDDTLKTVSLFSGGRILQVPAEPRLEKLAQAWAQEKSVYRRLLALQALEPFKSEQNIALATSLLADTRSETTRRWGKWQVGAYDVRKRSSRLLAEWQVSAPKLPMEGPILSYHQLPRPPITWIIGLFVTLLILALSAIRHRIFLQLAVNLMFISLIFALAILWFRSRNHIDEIMFAAGPSHHEFTSYSGGLHYALLRDWNAPRNSIYGSFERGFNEDVWSIDAQNPTTRKDFAGFVLTSGITPGPNGSSHRFALLRIPYWAPLMLLAVPLALNVLKLRRQFRRMRFGLCRKCGYDLRESRGRCPECGNELASPSVTGPDLCLALSSSTPAV
jgi:hypothetical protein